MVRCPRCGREGYGPYVMRVRRPSGRVDEYLYVVHVLPSGRRRKCYLGRPGESLSQPRVRPEEVLARAVNASWAVLPPRGPCPLCGRTRELPVHLICRARELGRAWEDIYICEECADRHLRGGLRMGVEMILGMAKTAGGS